MKSIIILIFALLALFSASKAQECTECTLVISMVESWVEQNATEAQILQFLDTLCTIVPSYQAVCDQIAESSLAQIIAYINQDQTPTEVCTEIGMCTSMEFQLIKNFFLATKVNDLECGSCEDVISTIEQWLDASNNQQEVITAIEVVCTYMPDWETTCDAMVEAGVPTVVTWIDTYENSTVVCDQLGLCTPTTPFKIFHSSDECGECEQIVTVIENYVASNATESAIESYLDIACTVVPQWTDVCENVIAQEIPQIITLLEQEEDPQAVCTALDLCSSNSKPTIFIN
jgi:hypothetical protein